MSDKKNANKIVEKAAELANQAKSKVAPLADKAMGAVESTYESGKKIAVEKAMPAVKQAIDSVTDKAKETADAANSKYVEVMDKNGDGKVDQEDMIILLNDIYAQSLNGISNISKPVHDICDEYLTRFKDPKIAAEKLIASDITKCTTSGFLTGFGGLITLPIAIPANISSVLYVQIRMIASIAYMAGLDVNSDATRTLVYACLAGISVADVIKQAGLKIGTKLTTSMIKKIPGKALTAINGKVGFRLLTKFGEKGIINLGKMVPVVGALIGGGFDLVETKIIANRALKEFFDGQYEISESDEPEIIDIDVNEA